MNIGDSAGPAEAGVDVNNRRPPEFGLHDPLKADWMAFGHVGTFNDDAIRVLQILLKGGGAAPAKRCPQTGDGGGVSDAGLVFDLDRTEGRVQLLHEVVLLVVEGRSPKAGDAHGAT